MTVIVPFLLDKRRRGRPIRTGERRGEIVIFSGVRIDRPVVDARSPEPDKRLPTPRLGR